MYTTVRGLQSEPEPADHPGPGRRGRRRRISSLILALGTVSFFTDLSSEMVVAVLPIYLTLVLGLTPLQYGVIDGLYQGVTAAVRIIGGMAADLTRRPKLVLIAGYGLSCVTKLAFLPASSFASLTGLVALDRAGKGMRTAPRDAMIAESAAPGQIGFAFGVHRAMDTAGALGGPLIAFGILGLLLDAYRAIFVLSFGLAAIGVAVLVLFVPEASRRPAVAVDAPVEVPVPASVPAPEQVHPRPRPSLRRTLREFGALLRGPTYRRLLGVGLLLSLSTVSDGFVYLTLKERLDISATWFPLLFVGTATGYLVLAVPFGRLADRIGRVPVFLGGHVLAALAYFALWQLPGGWWLLPVVLGLVGAYYAATDGILPAVTAPIVPESVRTTGIAGVQTVMALGAMASAGVFGALWSGLGQDVAVGVFTCGLAVGVMVAAALLRPAARTR